MNEIEIVKVKEAAPIVSPFKIVSNERYYFVGEMLKGIHVYEKKSGGVNYLCFVECQFMKAFDVIDGYLFCNNFIDLVVLDVNNPLQTRVLHRQKNHFNQYRDFIVDWNIPYNDKKGCIVGEYIHTITGPVTETNTDLDFSEADKLYENLTTKEIPKTWASDYPERDKPYVGIARVGQNEIYTSGMLNNWAICTYQSGSFNVREEYGWSRLGRYDTPDYIYSAPPVDIFMKDQNLYVQGVFSGGKIGYIEAILPDVEAEYGYLIFPKVIPIDITYMSELKAFFYLDGKSIYGAFIDRDNIYSVIEMYKDYQIPTNALGIERIGAHLVTLGVDGLAIYLPGENGIEFVKEYPDIAGKCYLKEANMLIIANADGLFLYDIEDVEEIKPIL